MADQTTTLISTGGLASRLGYSISNVKKLEKLGRIPAGIVIEGSGRKVWRAEDIEAIQEQLQARRRKAADAMPLTAA